MNGLNSKIVGGLAFLVGLISILTLLTLLLFFAGLYQIIPAISFMGSFNDLLGPIASILSALLATGLYQSLGREMPRVSPLLLIGVWIGAAATIFGAWLILTGRSDVELSGYYFFFGNGLFGLWMLMLNRSARQHAVWPRNLTLLGLIAAGFMVVGLLGLYGILIQADGDAFSPLLLLTGLSYPGITIIYPIWCLWLGRWVLARPHDSVSLVSG